MCAAQSFGNVQHESHASISKKSQEIYGKRGQLVHAHSYYNRVLWWHKGPFSPHLALGE